MEGICNRSYIVGTLYPLKFIFQRGKQLSSKPFSVLLAFCSKSSIRILKVIVHIIVTNTDGYMCWMGDIYHKRRGC